VDRPALPHGRVAPRPGDRRALDGRLRRDELRGAPPGPVHRRGQLLGRRRHEPAGAGRDGFALSGSGRATVTTPARYAAGRRYEVVVRGPAPARRSLLADARGRLHIAVGLGASNTVQQDSPQSQAAPTIARTARVTIAAG
jgi:hypothetical protein